MLTTYLFTIHSPSIHHPLTSTQGKACIEFGRKLYIKSSESEPGSGVYLSINTSILDPSKSLYLTNIPSDSSSSLGMHTCVYVCMSMCMCVCINFMRYCCFCTCSP